MKREDYYEAKALISKIDNLSRSADIVSEILENLEKNSGSAKIYTRTGSRTYETELGGADTKAVFREVQKTYCRLIKDTKRLLDDLIDGVIEDTGLKPQV